MAQNLKFKNKTRPQFEPIDEPPKPLPRMSFRDFVSKAYPRYQWYKHCEVMAAALQRVADGELNRLMVFMPPRHGKSQLVSRLFPAYLLHQHQDKWVGMNCYGADLAYGFSRNSREFYTRAGGELSDDAAAVKFWQTRGEGGLWAAGVGGAITGRGFHCFPEGTMVSSEWGKIDIASLVGLSSPPRVYSFNHKTKEIELQRIIARASQDRECLVEVRMSSGRSFRSTPDHLVYSPECGYREAGSLARGQKVIYLKSPQSLQGLQYTDPQKRALQALLSPNQELQVLGRMPTMLNSFREAEVRGAKGTQEGAFRFLLQPEMQPGSPLGQEPQDLQRVRKPYGDQVGAMLQCLSRKKAAQELVSNPSKGLRLLWRGVRASFLKGCLLLKAVSKPSPRSKDARERKQPFQGWQELCQVVQRDEADHLPSRSKQVRCLRRKQQGSYNKKETQERGISEAVYFASPSHRQRPRKQCRIQSGADVLHLPQETSFKGGQWGYDTVSSVTFIRGESQPVYDIQVEGNSNFFANEILVHNCGLIDDPLKNAEEATSTTIREKHKSWYESTFYTREEPGGAIVLIMTRWHEDDLAGWLLSQEEVEPEGWHIINFDAIYEGPRLFPETCTVEPDWRKPGEALCPERYDVQKLEKIKAKVGSYFWGALYQQRPSPLEGGLFKRDNWKYYQQLPGRFDRVILSWDMAFKETKGGSFVVGQVWGQVGAEFYLLDQVRDRMDFAATVAAVKAMVAKWPNASAKLVEDKANGSAVISHLRREVPGLVAVQPKGGKEVRAVAVSPYVEAGNVYLPVPQLAPWIGDYVDEFARFPNAGVDDQVDATTQALTYLNDSQPQGNKRRYGTVSGQNW